MVKVLLVEDDPQIAKSLSLNLSFNGFDVAIAETLAQAWAKLTARSFDLFLFDVGLPDGTGIELCQRVRAAGKTTPVLFLSARTDEETVVKGMNVGADDYVRKPFGIEELKVRIQRVLKRAPPAGNVILAGPLSMDLDKRLVAIDGRSMTLGRREFEILAQMARRNGDVVTREAILENLEEKPELYDRTIDSHMSHLRKKLREAAGTRVQIVAVYGVGYRLQIQAE